MSPAIFNANSKLVTVFGGSGFLGRYVVRALAAKGYRVRVACRRPDLAGHLQPLGNVGQIHCMQANLRYRWSIDRAVEDADVVVNLVGILTESGKQSFDSLQARGAAWVAEATAQAGAKLVQISAIGADSASPAIYASTKAAGEKAVRSAVPDAIIIRPSILFGPEDDFFNRFAALAQISPVLPLIGGGMTKFQPVYVGDVAEVISRAVTGELEPGSTWELGGPEVLTFKQCLERMLQVVVRKRLLISMPFALAKSIGKFAQFLPGAPITPDQVELLKSDNVVSKDCLDSGHSFAGLGMVPSSLMSVLPQYLVRFRKHGQFEANRGL